MESDFKKWLSKQNPSWYLLEDEDYEWYLNQWLNKIEDKRKEQDKNEMVQRNNKHGAVKKEI